MKMSDVFQGDTFAPTFHDAGFITKCARVVLEKLPVTMEFQHSFSVTDSISDFDIQNNANSTIYLENPESKL